jgi:GT2 family glycosyltransferase
VVVLDNASTDGSPAMVASNHPSVSLMRSAVNLGYAAGVNKAANATTDEFILLVNSDAELHPSAVQSLVDAARRNPDAGPIGGRALTADARLDPRSCWGLPTGWSLFCFGSGLSTLLRSTSWFDPESLGRWPRDTEREVGAVSGTILFMERALWTRLGGFDADYFMYSEDIDLADRAAALGRPAMITPGAVVTHVGGASSSSSADKMVLIMKGKATYLRKRWSPAAARFGLTMLWAGSALRAIMERVTRRPADRRTWTTVWSARRQWLPGYPSASGRPSTDRRPGRVAAP